MMDSLDHSTDDHDLHHVIAMVVEESWIAVIDRVVVDVGAAVVVGLQNG